MPNLQFKTIDDPEIIEKGITDRNAYHSNQTQGTLLTIGPMLSLIGTDSYTPFSQELLRGIASITSLNMLPTISKYLNKLRQNKEIVSTKKKHIPLKEYIKKIKKWKESTTSSPSGRYLGCHHSVLSPDGNQYNKDKKNSAIEYGNSTTVSHQLLCSMKEPSIDGFPQ